MTTQWHTKMKGVISELLETMFFMSVDFEHESAATHYSLESSISLARDLQKIHINLLMTEPFARVAAANFLGVDENEVAPYDIEDVVKEMANMIGGSYMTVLENGDWQLGIPSMRYLEGSHDAPDGDAMPISYFGDQVGAVILTLESSSI